MATEYAWKRSTKKKEQRFKEDFVFDILDRHIVIKQAEVDSIHNLGHTVWDGSLVLSKYLTRLSQGFFVGKKVLELGSGTGLVGIVASLLGADVTFTDYENFELLNENIHINITNIKSVRVKKFDWNDNDAELQSLSLPFDIVLGSELVYYSHLLPVLVKALNNVCDKNTLLLMAGEVHNEFTTKYFVEQISRTFELQQISHFELDPEYQAPDILVWKLHKKEYERDCQEP